MTNPTARTAFDLCQQPVWPAERLRGLPGHCRGSLLKDWAKPVTERFGAGAADTIRTQLIAADCPLPNVFEPNRWYPVSTQILLTQSIRDTFFANDPLEFCQTLVTAGRMSSTPWVARILKTVGPAIILRNATRIHPHLYDIGTASATIIGHVADIVCTGAELFENPLWRCLQLIGQQGLIELCGARFVSATGYEAGTGAFGMKIEWNVP